MYSYYTGTSFQRAENPFLLQAMQLARPGAKLLTRKQLADDGPGGVLGECYQKVKGAVNKTLCNLFASQVMHGRMLGTILLSTTWLYLQLNHFPWKRYTPKSKAMMRTGLPDVSRVIDRQCGWCSYR